MPGVRVVTDSASDISVALAAEEGITIVPLTIRFGAEEFVDQRDLSPEEFWKRCKESPTLPETAAPSPGAFQESFTQAKEAGFEGVLCINISSELSATYQAARTAAGAMEGFPVEVIDSRSVTMGQGLLALAAAQDAKAGAALADIVRNTRERMGRTHVFGAVDTLEHLQKGGRIGGAQAFLGTVLSIKPVVSVEGGKVEPESRQRTRSRSLEYLANKVLEGRPLERVAIVNGAAPDLDLVTSKLASLSLMYPLVNVDLGPVVGTHTGPGTIGAAFITAAGH
jgi:DegV family protein with EDD domain